MPPPAVPPPAVASPRAAPPPLTQAQREQLRAALGHETYQQVVDAALKVDKTADRHQAAAAHRAALALKAGEMPRALRRAAASVQRVQEQQSSLESSVARLEKVARAFVKGHGRQVAQTAAGKQEKAPTEPQMQQMVPGREGRAGGRETELADAAALRGMPKLLLDTARAPAPPRKLLQKRVAQLAVSRGDSAADLAQRVTDMGVTWNRILHPDPILSEHPSWALPQLHLHGKMPARVRIEAPGSQLRWAPYVPPSL